METVTVEGIVHWTLWARRFKGATENELRRLRRRYSQLADTFFEYDPTSGVPVFEALDAIDKALAGLREAH